MEAATDPRFGRCTYFVVVDTDTMQFQAVENVAAMQGSGAGIAAAQLVANTGAEAIVAGNFGPNASQTLAAGGIRLYSSPGGTVREVVEALKTGQLQGMGGAGTGMGMGGGRGMGMGGGRGMGMGMGMNPPMAQPGVAAGPAATPEQLKAQAEALQKQLQDLQEQLKKLQGEQD